MPLPTPALGLVVRYGFVWAGLGRRPPPDSGKDRPCLIVDLDRDEPVSGTAVLRVTYLPISHVAPRVSEQGIPIPPRVMQHLGLDLQRSYVYTSYGNEDDWPFDLAPLPRRLDTFHYGFVPPRLFAAVAGDFAVYLQTHPRFVHRRTP
jgi:hypothetical protein